MTKNKKLDPARPYAAQLDFFKGKQKSTVKLIDGKLYVSRPAAPGGQYALRLDTCFHAGDTVVFVKIGSRQLTHVSGYYGGRSHAFHIVDTLTGKFEEVSYRLTTKADDDETGVGPLEGKSVNRTADHWSLGWNPGNNPLAGVPPEKKH